MKHDINRIIHSVRLALGYSHGEEPLIHCHDPDTISLDRLILDKIQQSAHYVYTNGPTEMIAQGAIDIGDEEIYWHEPTDGYVSGHIILPRDYVRLYVFQMSDWDYAVHDAVTDKSPLYAIYQSKISGIRGTPYIPQCIIHQASEGKTLEFQSSRSKDEFITQAKYIPMPKIDPYGCIDIANEAVDEVINTAAVLTLTSMGEYDKAQKILNLLSICQQSIHK